ncbi:hypothetical protein NM208_g3891 [Fusarium decemcellulare]|uniref:Uncharacterized protein n=1 Tax=Fusarium decemcellulare TaxID=57161 RepID=A0ACC1SMQ6_9HYPO|nr:hypothetical protein NM208_g3891 [Fusarium decemcellulare]
MGRETSCSERPVYPSPRSTSCNIQTGDFDFDSGDMHCPNLEPQDSTKGTKALEAVPMEAFDDFFSSFTDIEQPTTTDWSDMIEIDSDLVTSFLPTGPSCASSNGAAHDEGGFKHAPPDRSTSGKCVCVQKAMLTHEDICINVLWSMRRMTKSQLAEARGSDISPSTVAEMLQCIKRTTRSNEELLYCHISCERQGFMVLIIMMCDIMLDGLENLAQQLRHDGLSGGMKHDEHNSLMQTLVTIKAPEPSSSFSNMQFSNGPRGMGANDSILPSSGTRAGREWNKEGLNSRAGRELK